MVPGVASITTANTKANGRNYNADGACYTLDLANSNAVAIDYKQTPNVSEGIAHTLTHEGSGGINSAVAFAQNTRDEVRLFGGDGRTVGALSAQPGMKQTSYVMTQYGDVAGTLRARADSSPCVDSGQNVVCMQDGQSNGTIAEDGTSTTLNASHEQPISVYAVDCRNLELREGVSGTLQAKENGDHSLNYQNPVLVRHPE